MAVAPKGVPCGGNYSRVDIVTLEYRSFVSNSGPNSPRKSHHPLGET